MSFNAAGLMTSRIEAYGTALARTTTYEYQAGANLMTATVDGLGRRIRSSPEDRRRRLITH